MSEETNKTEQQAAISNPATESSELSEESLKNVAGGTPKTTTTTTTTTPTESVSFNFGKVQTEYHP
jgi:hypothetical protein